MRVFFLLLSVAFLCNHSKAATVDTISIHSTVMNKAWKCTVIKPDSYSADNKDKKFPVVYLLHGYSGNYADWVRKAAVVKKYADEYQLLIVCPDGDFSSWYFDSPIDSTKKMETYVGTEIPAYIDANYHTIADRKARAITGLSMGGHGGLFLGFRHADIFGACGSMSGGVDMRPFPKNWEISKKIGDITNAPDNWKNYSVITVIEKKPVLPLAVIVDCGTEDFFYEVNTELHKKMLQLKIPHDYIERPGKHDWNYWTNAVQYQLIYFKNYFTSAK